MFCFHVVFHSIQLSFSHCITHVIVQITCNEYNEVFFVIGTVQKCKPDLEDVLNLLKRRSCKWYEIGVGLKVDNGFCQCQLKESIMTSDLEKLKAVLNKWIESECSEVSWNHLIQVLIDIELVDVAKKVRSYLQTDLSAIKKYRWVNNMHEGYTYTTKFVIISLFFAVVFIFIFW